MSEAEGDGRRWRALFARLKTAERQGAEGEEWQRGAAVVDLQNRRLDGAGLAAALEAVARPEGVTRLYVGNNEAERLPAALARFANLELLYAGGNRLTDLPDELFGLSRLQTLYLPSNELARLSPAVARLSSLTALSLHTNRLSSVPQSLATLSLRTLYLANNPLPAHLARNDFHRGAELAAEAAAFFARHEPCRAAVRCVMMTGLRRGRAATLAGLPRELRRLVAEAVWRTRDADEWGELAEQEKQKGKPNGENN